MNTKAATAATNAPTAKDESKNTASAGNTKAANSAKFIPMTAEEQETYKKLKENFHDLDEKDEARLIELKKKFKAAESSKGSYINQLKNEIGQSGLTISDLFKPNEIVGAYPFKDLFTAEELKAAILTTDYGVKDLFTEDAIKAAVGVKTGKGGKSGKGTDAGDGEAKGSKSPKYKSGENGMVMFEFPKPAQGQSPKPYYKGRAFEDAKKADEQGYAMTYKHDQVPADGKKPWNIYPSGQTVPSGVYTYLDETNYKNYIPAQNKGEIDKYLATAEGKTELALILEEAKRGRAANKKDLVPFKKA